ncbi:hypothetical protein Salat_2455900 [Sesamum alatum]|uniref:Uncharacterized protein n=1 Tax=Sesamum alatum TaxID=300844 RepID=A0AAE1XQQ4_9LAMI|nr:hypothetical protein Salat_2455900 [Sesamum alatum]
MAKWKDKARRKKNTVLPLSLTSHTSTPQFSPTDAGAFDGDEGGPHALVIGKEGEASLWTSSVCAIPDPSSPLGLAIDGGSSNSTPPHGLNMLQNLKSAWFAKFGSAEPVSLARPPPPAVDDGVVSAAPDGLSSRVSAPQEHKWGRGGGGVSSARVPRPPPSDSVSSPPRIPAPPALPEAFSGRAPSPPLTSMLPKTLPGPPSSQPPFAAASQSASMAAPLLSSSTPLDHSKKPAFTPSNESKEIAIHNSFQELARSDDVDLEAPLVDPCPGTPSQYEPPPGVP